MSKQQEFFNYYCLDRLKLIDNELPLSYIDDGLIRKFYYKIGLISRVKSTISYVLYDEEDFEELTYISCEYADDHRESLMLYPQDKETFFGVVKKIQTINIFQFTSMLNFDYIYSDFKDIIEYNWDTLKMDSLIEIE